MSDASKKGEGLMYATRRGLRALALVMSLLMAFTVSGLVAWADKDAQDGGSNKLLVHITGDETSELASLSTEYDVYKIASATKDSNYDTYNYDFDISAFASLQSYFFPEMDGAKWQEMADRAAEVVEDASPAKTVTATTEETLTGLGDGLFLVLAKDVYTTSYIYSFNPTIISLPTKAPLTDDSGSVIVDENGYPVIGTSVDYGPWSNDPAANFTPEITLKYSQSSRYGSLAINKTVYDFAGEPATFVFRITGMQPDGVAYDNYASVYYDGGDSAMTIVPHIMAGTTVTIEEVYAGGRYRPVPGSLLTETAFIEADVTEDGESMSPVTVPFRNIDDTPDPLGHGIENRFTYGADGDWAWEAVPADEASPATTE